MPKSQIFGSGFYSFPVRSKSPNRGSIVSQIFKSPKRVLVFSQHRQKFSDRGVSENRNSRSRLSSPKKKKWRQIWIFCLLGGSHLQKVVIFGRVVLWKGLVVVSGRQGSIGGMLKKFQISPPNPGCLHYLVLHWWIQIACQPQGGATTNINSSVCALR